MRKMNKRMIGFILISSSLLLFSFLSINNISNYNRTITIKSLVNNPGNNFPTNRAINSTNGIITNRTIIPSPSVVSIPVKIKPIENVSEGINPYYLYSSEPAPIGISDIGINPTTNGTYSYNTTAFLGTATINSLTTSGGAYSGWVSLQLNVELKFTVGSSTYVYWLQNIAQIDTANNNQFNILDNVWNMSSTFEDIAIPGISGSGNIGEANGSRFYYCQPASSICCLTYPDTIQMKIISSLGSNNKPIVTYEYNNGNGTWTTYDVVTFTPISGPVSDMNLVVDGSQYTPSEEFFDSEFVLCGVGDWATTSLQSGSNLNLRLEYYNGNNFQFIPYEYSFGVNTGETISNVVDQINYYNSGGAYFNQLTPGSGNYVEPFFTSPAFANFILPYNSGGTFDIGSSPYSKINYNGDQANITIYPGTYIVYVGSWENTYTFSSGINSPITLPGVPTNPTSLTAVNLNGYTDLNWLSPSSNCGSSLLYYAIYRGTTPGSESELTTINTTSYEDNNVVPGTTYFYSITAVNSIGASSKSNKANITIPPVIPDAPTNVNATFINGTDIITWMIPGFDGGSPILNYTIYRGTSPGNETCLCNTTTTSYVDNNTVPGTTYYYTITAVNSVGQSTYSHEVSVSIPNKPFNWPLTIAISIIGIGAVVGIGTTIYILKKKSRKYSF